MHTQAGIWVDHRKAVIVLLNEENEEIKEIQSNIEKHVRYAGGSASRNAEESHPIIPEDKRDRKYINHLNNYYDDIITSVSGANAIFILGPGEAKGELKKLLTSKKYGERNVTIEAADKMAVHEIIAKVRQHFHKHACC